MHLAALLVGLIACAGIIVLGIRFLLQPRQATLDFGVAADNLRALTEIKGARDITSGVVLLVVLASAGRVTFGWALVAAAITPTADALIVLTNGGKLAKALSVHGLTAALPDRGGLRSGADVSETTRGGGGSARARSGSARTLRSGARQVRRTAPTE